MKKIKGALTTTEKLVVSNNKKIAVLFLVLVISVALNIIYITGISDKIFPQKGESEEIIENNQASDIENNGGEELSEDRLVSTEDAIDKSVDNKGDIDDLVDEKTIEDDKNSDLKNFDADEMLRSLYDSDDEEQYAALKDNYDNAKLVSHKLRDSGYFTIKCEDEVYEFRSYGGNVSFSTGRDGCTYTRTKIEELYEIIDKSELKENGFHSYANSNEIVIGVGTPKTYIYDAYRSIYYYPPQNMEEIVEFCRELKKVMLNN